MENKNLHTQDKKHSCVECLAQNILESAIFKALTNIYFAIVILDLQANAYEILKGNTAVHALLDKRGKATDALLGMVEKLTADKERSGLFEFNDFPSIAERLGDKDIITFDYTGITSGWSRAAIYPLERDENGKVTKVLYCTRILREDAALDKNRENTANRYLEEMQRQQGIIDALGKEYELLQLIDVSTKKFVFYRATNKEIHREAIQIFGEHYARGASIDDAMNTYIDFAVHPEDREKIRFIANMEKVLELVPQKGTYTVPCRCLINIGTQAEDFLYIQINYARFQGSDGREYLVQGFRNVDATMRAELQVRESRRQNQEIIESMATRYTVAYLIDLDERTFKEVNTKSGIKGILGKTGSADWAFSIFVDNMVREDYQELMRNFTNLDTMVERLADRQIITVQYYGSKFVNTPTGEGWAEGSLIAVKRDENGRLKQAIYATETVNDSKEKELRQQETLQRRMEIIDSLGEIYSSVFYVSLEDHTFQTVKATDKFRKALGEENNATNAFAKVCGSLMGAEYAAAMLEFTDLNTLEERMKGQQIISTQYFGRLTDTEERGWIEASFIVGDRDENGKLLHVLYASRHVYSNLAINSQTLPVIESLADSLPGGFFIYRADDTKEFIYVNHRIRQICGCSTDEEFIKLTGNSFSGMLYEEDRDTVEKSIWQQIIHSDGYLGQQDHVRYRVSTLNGELRWLDDYGHLVHTEEYGDVFYVFAADITEAAQKEEREKFVRDKGYETGFFLTHQILGSGMWGMAFDEQGNMKNVTWSSEFRKMLGYSSIEEFPNKLESWSDLLHPDDKERVLKEYYATINDYTGKKVYDVEYRLQVKSGEWRWYHAAGRVARRKDGTPDIYVGIFVDITEKKIKDELLRTALAQAESANRAKSDFLANMSHDIRTPMNGIVGMTAIAATHIDDKERVTECLQKITGASRHLLALINEVLDMSKIESGKVDLSEEEFNLSELVENMVSMVQPQVEEHGHDFRIGIRNVIHEKVIGVPLRMQQIFMNMMSNAVKYTPDGGKITLTIEEKPTGKAKVGCFVFTFEDNGIGMSEDFQKQIFEPFTRAEDGRITKIQGTGLGMPIARNIARMTGGDIEVKSKLDEGSTFTVTLFLELQEENAIDYSEFTDLRVLVADDDPDACESACIILDDIGMKSEGVNSGKEAVKAVIEHHQAANDFFAVILDWKMPDMDGVHTARIIREKVGPDVPIIIISAYDWSDIEQEARTAGVDAFVSKPLFKSRLVRVFDTIINKGETKSKKEEPLEDITSMDLSGHRVLLVEDNELNSEIATEILSMTGLEVECAEDGTIAVDKMNACPDDYYDLIFMDIQMPKMNGYEATRAIRAMDRVYAKRIPIIAMSANAFAQDIAESRNAGMNEHIAKPIDMHALARVLSHWIHK